MYNQSSSGAWATTQLAGELPQGSSTLTTTVYFTDPLGTAHSWSDDGRPVSVNSTVVPLQVTATPSSGYAPLATGIQVSTSDPSGLTLQYSVDFGDGSSEVSGSTDYPYSSLSINHTFESAGLYTVTVTVADGSSGSAERQINVKVESPTLPVSLVTLPFFGNRAHSRRHSR